MIQSTLSFTDWPHLHLLNSTCTESRKLFNRQQYLLSPGRNAVMGTFSWQSWSGCQLALQAEQNSSVQTLHRTNCGSAVSDSFSWHTAWHVEDGHQVRLGSSSTSAGGERWEIRRGFHECIFLAAYCWCRLTGHHGYTIRDGGVIEKEQLWPHMLSGTRYQSCYQS